MSYKTNIRSKLAPFTRQPNDKKNSVRASVNNAVHVVFCIYSYILGVVIFYQEYLSNKLRMNTKM